MVGPEVVLFLGLFAGALLSTLFFELVVAALLHVGRRGLLAVMLVNVLTNPLFNLALLLFVYMVGLGGGDFTRYDWALLPGTVVLELIVVLVEWRLYVWVTQGTAGSSSRLLVLSIVANAASAIGPLAIAAVNWGGITFPGI